jgi:hypothetical protein
MKKIFTVTVLVVGLLGTAAGQVFAADVLLPGSSAPAQVVAARKYAMGAIGGLVGDIKAKIAAGGIKAITASARAMASLATFLPLVYDETYAEVYPVEGSKYFFKGGAAAELAARAGDFKAAAEQLAGLAEQGDKAAVDAQSNQLLAACGACHTSFRGQY